MIALVIVAAGDRSQAVRYDLRAGGHSPVRPARRVWRQQFIRTVIRSRCRGAGSRPSRGHPAACVARTRSESAPGSIQTSRVDRRRPVFTLLCNRGRGFPFVWERRNRRSVLSRLFYLIIPEQPDRPHGFGISGCLWKTRELKTVTIKRPLRKPPFDIICKEPPHEDLTDFAAPNPYPGRRYRIRKRRSCIYQGRSENSRNRIFVRPRTASAPRRTTPPGCRIPA